MAKGIVNVLKEDNIKCEMPIVLKKILDLAIKDSTALKRWKGDAFTDIALMAFDSLLDAIVKITRKSQRGTLK